MALVLLDEVTIFPLVMYQLSLQCGIKFEMLENAKPTESNRMAAMLLKGIDDCLKDKQNPLPANTVPFLDAHILQYLPQKGWTDRSAIEEEKYRISSSEITWFKRGKYFLLDSLAYANAFHYAMFICDMSSCDITCKECDKV